MAPISEIKNHEIDYFAINYLLNLILDTVLENEGIEIRRSIIYRKSFWELKSAAVLDKYLLVLQDHGFIYYIYKPKSNKKKYIILNPHLS